MLLFDDKESGLVVSCSFEREFDFMPPAEIKARVDDLLLREAAERVPNGKFIIRDREHPDEILRRNGDRYRCVFLEKANG